MKNADALSHSIDVSFLGADALMGSSASSSGAPGGYPPPPANGTTLEAALAQIEEEQLQKVRAPPGPTPRADPSLTRVTERCRHRPRGGSNGPDSTLHRPNPTSHPAILPSDPDRP